MLANGYHSFFFNLRNPQTLLHYYTAFELFLSNAGLIPWYILVSSRLCYRIPNIIKISGVF